MNSRHALMFNRKKPSRFLILIILILVAVLFSSIYQLYSDAVNLQAGAAALESGDLERAYAAFYEVDVGFRLVDFLGNGENAHHGIAAAANQELKSANAFFLAGKFTEAFPAFLRLRDQAQRYRLDEFSTLARTRMLQSFENMLKRFNSAYASGDCGAALSTGQWLKEIRDVVVEIDGAADIDLKLARCEEFLSQVNDIEPGNPPSAANRLASFLAGAPTDPLSARVRQELETLIHTYGLKVLASPSVCSHVFPKEDFTHIEVVADDLFYCASAYYQAGQDLSAIHLLETFVTSFPQERNYQAAVDLLARLLLDQANAVRQSDLPSPQPSGYGEEGRSHYIVQNDSPFPIRVTFKGGLNAIKTLPACQDCQVYTHPPLTCPDQGQQEDFALPPGTYEVLIDSPVKTPVTPGRGSFDMLDGQTYSTCFFVVMPAN